VKLLALAITAGVLAGSAYAAPQPLSPAPEAIVGSSHPVFSWTMPIEEQPWALYIARRPETTPDGKFYDENVTDTALFWPNETYRWAPTSGLYAARYWWLVESVTREGFELHRSAPQAFLIPTQVQVLGLRTRRYTFIRNVDFAVSYRSNTRAVVAHAAIRTLSGRRLWSSSEADANFLGSTATINFQWYARKNVRAGTRVRFMVTLRSQGTARSLSRILRAP
jgi:hypothetical protein